MVFIVAGGPKAYLPDLQKFAKEMANSIWIGADAGALVLLALGIPIDHAIGDFDSIDIDAYEQIKRMAKDFQQFPIEKNETDLELALNLAIQYKEDIIIFGATGGRTDHFLSNIMMLTHYAMNQHITLVDQQNEMTILLPGEASFGKESAFLPDAKYISFLPISETLEEVTLTGFKYNLTPTTFYRHQSFGVSNEIVSDAGHIFFSKGICLVVRSKD